MKPFLLIAALALALTPATIGCKEAPTGTWREGFKAAYAKALTFKSWDQMYDWAEAGMDADVISIRIARSTDLAGGRHDYINTRAGGFKDGCTAIYDEMRFIGNHNSGDTKHFFEMTQEWIRMQTPDTVIPPGHF